MFKYIDLFKRTLSGSIGKNLLNLEFPLEAELGDGQQKFSWRFATARFRTRNCWTPFTTKSSNLSVPGKLSDSSGLRRFMTFPPVLPTVWKWRIPPTICIPLFSAASAPWRFPSPASATTRTAMPLLTKFRTGWFRNRIWAFCFRPSTTGIQTSTVCSIIPEIRKNFILKYRKISSAVPSPSQPRAERNLQRSGGRNFRGGLRL